MKKNEAAILYNFKTAKVKEAAKKYAFDNKTSVQAMLTEAFEAKFPKIAKTK